MNSREIIQHIFSPLSEEEKTQAILRAALVFLQLPPALIGTITSYLFYKENLNYLELMPSLVCHAKGQLFTTPRIALADKKCEKVVHQSNVFAWYIRDELTNVSF